MIIYKCDGDSFSTGKKCINEVTHDLPDRWLTISGKIENGLKDAHYIEANGTYHFCSRRCLENFLFKDLNAASATTGNSNMGQFDPPVKQDEAAEQQPADVAPEVKEATEGDAKEGNGELKD